MQYNKYSLGTEGKTFFILEERGTNVIVEEKSFFFFSEAKVCSPSFLSLVPFSFLAS